jgi:hypothetical protein
MIHATIDPPERIAMMTTWPNTDGPRFKGRA